MLSGEDERFTQGQLTKTLCCLQLAAEEARKEAERKAAEEAAAARRAEDERLDREQAAARVSEARERRTWAADGALTRGETEFGVAWACDPPVRSKTDCALWCHVCPPTSMT